MDRMTNNNDIYSIEMVLSMLDILSRDHGLMKMMIGNKQEDHHEVNMQNNDHQLYLNSIKIDFNSLVKSEMNSMQNLSYFLYQTTTLT